MNKNKYISDLETINVSHLKDSQKVELLTLQMKYTIENAFEGIVEALQPVFQRFSDSIKNEFLKSATKTIKGNEDGNTK